MIRPHLRPHTMLRVSYGLLGVFFVGRSLGLWEGSTQLDGSNWVTLRLMGEMVEGAEIENLRSLRSLVSLVSALPTIICKAFSLNSLISLISPFFPFAPSIPSIPSIPTFFSTRHLFLLPTPLSPTFPARFCCFTFFIYLCTLYLYNVWSW